MHLGGEEMAASVQDQIDLAAAFVRLYVFLTQYLDRCFDEAARKHYPDAELQAHLAETRRQLMDILSVNPVVQKKLAEECDRILALGAACVKSGTADAKVREVVQSERAMLRSKTIALSDLVAVFRALG
jgi:DICT domain-containing protein